MFSEQPLSGAVTFLLGAKYEKIYLLDKFGSMK